MIDEGRMLVNEGQGEEQSLDFGMAAYGEMQRNYVALKAVGNRILALPHLPEEGSSNQEASSVSGDVVVASASTGIDVPVGVPIPKKNGLIEEEIEELKANYSIPPSIGLRLQTSTDTVRYPS